MKVAFLSKSLGVEAGGLLPVMQSLGRYVSTLGIDVHAFGIRDRKDFPQTRDWHGVTTSVHPWHGPHAFGFSPEMIAELRKFSPDLLHAHGIFNYTSIVTRSYAKENRKNYIVSPHGMLDKWALTNSRMKKIIAGILFERENLKNASCIHSLCDAETEAIRSYGINTRIVQIPNGIDIQEKPKNLNISPFGKIEKGRKILLYLGRLHRKKGLVSLLHAWSLVKEKKEWVLAIAGWDQRGHENELKKIALDLNIANEIFFLGPQYGESKVSAYHYASGFVLPSLSEGLPMAVLEAWSNGLPVLMTLQCNIPDGFDQAAAIRIETSSKDIARGLTELFEMSKSERKKMGQNGLNLVKQQFSWSSVAEQMRQVYEWLQGGGPPTDCKYFV